MNYKLANKYASQYWMSKIMGPNPLKLTEELLQGHNIPSHAVVCDLGSGQGLTSVFLTKEYGFKVYASDLCSGAKDTFSFELNDDTTIIAVYRNLNAYEEVLVKAEDGSWQRVKQ